MEQQSDMNLPPHILEEEILLCLPVKTLSRFKCVCKRWLSLIESQSFIDSHYSRERDDDHLVLFEYLDKVRHGMRLIEVDPNQRFPESEGIELIGPQLGLFCLVNSIGDITLFNPATRLLKRVPPIPSNIDPSSRKYGFGLNPLTRDYKIVMFCEPRQDEPTTSVCIYNSTSDSWKHKEALVMDSMLEAALNSHCKTFVNGVYYWLVFPGYKNEDGVILAFDMMIERFRELQLPHDYIHKKEVQICVRDDSLALLAFDFKQVDLWVMGKEGFGLEVVGLALS